MYAKIRVDAIFHMRDVRGNVLPRFIEASYGNAMFKCPSEGYQHGGRKTTEISVTKFCYERDFIPRGTYKH